MLGRVGREIGPHLRRGQLVLSVIAGATTAALTGTLGHDQVIRAMPNTPARLGKGMTVWYATPETTAEQRAQAAALLGALGAQLEVDDEKFVAMATAVSGTGPTYVFLVMEALIDAAVHLGFPRHVAHDLVIETLEGSTLFAKQSGMHPAELRNMVTSPGGTSAAALHELESGRLRTVLSEAVWAAYRRTVELGDQLEASVAEAAGDERGGRRVDVATGGSAALRLVDAGRAGDRPAAGPAGRRPGDRLPRAGPRLLGGRGRALGPVRRVWAGLDDAAWRLPGRRAVGRRRPGLVARSITSPTSSTGRRSPIDYIGGRSQTGRWPTDDDYDGGDFDTFNERRRERVARRSRRPSSAAGSAPPARRCCRSLGRLDLATIRSDAAWGWVYNVLHGHDLDHLRVIEPWADALRARQVRERPVRRPIRSRSRRTSPRPGRVLGRRGAVTALFRRDRARRCPTRPGRAPRSTPAGRSPTTSATSPAGSTRRPASSTSTDRAGRGGRLPAEGDRRLERAPTSLRRAGHAAGDAPRRLRRGPRPAHRGVVAAMPDDDWLDPEGFSWAYEDLHGHVRAHLAMIAPYAARAGWPMPDRRTARDVTSARSDRAARSDAAGAGARTEPARRRDRRRRTGRARTCRPAGLTIEAIVAVESPREFRLHPRDRSVAYTADVGRRPPALRHAAPRRLTRPS